MFVAAGWNCGRVQRVSLILVHGRILSVLEICIFSNFPHRNVNGCDSKVGALSRLWEKITGWTNSLPGTSRPFCWFVHYSGRNVTGCRHRPLNVDNRELHNKSASKKHYSYWVVGLREIKFSVYRIKKLRFAYTQIAVFLVFSIKLHPYTAAPQTQIFKYLIECKYKFSLAVYFTTNLNGSPELVPTSKSLQ